MSRIDDETDGEKLKPKSDKKFEKREAPTKGYIDRMVRVFTDPDVSRAESYEAMNLPSQDLMDAGLAQQFNEHGERNVGKQKGILSKATNFLDQYLFGTSSEKVNKKVTDFLGTTSSQSTFFPEVNSKHTKELNKHAEAVGAQVKDGRYPNQKVITDPKVRTGSPIFPYRQMSPMEMEKKNKTAPESVFNKYMHRAAAFRSAERKGEPRPGKEYAPGYRNGGILYSKLKK